MIRIGRTPAMTQFLCVLAVLRGPLYRVELSLSRYKFFSCVGSRQSAWTVTKTQFGPKSNLNRAPGAGIARHSRGNAKAPTTCPEEQA